MIFRFFTLKWALSSVCAYKYLATIKCFQDTSFAFIFSDNSSLHLQLVQETTFDSDLIFFSTSRMILSSLRLSSSDAVRIDFADFFAFQMKTNFCPCIFAEFCTGNFTILSKFASVVSSSTSLLALMQLGCSLLLSTTNIYQ